VPGRRIAGGLILALLAVPALFGTVMVVGMSRSVLNGWFSEENAKKVTKKIPGLAADAFEAAKAPGAISDPATKAWVEAAAKLKVSPVDVLKRVGVFAWVDSEVPRIMGIYGAMLHGHRPLGRVTMELKPLKEALSSPQMRQYLADVLRQLPACGPKGQTMWAQRVQQHATARLPACNPGVGLEPQAVNLVVDRVAKIPDETVLGHSDRDVPKIVLLGGTRFIWLLFFVPGLLLVAGALIYGSAGRRFWGAMGTATLVGGGLAAALSGLIKGMMSGVVHTDPSSWSWEGTAAFWNTDAGHILGKKMASLAAVFMNDLFTSVLVVAGWVCLIGVVFLVVSLFVRRGD